MIETQNPKLTLLNLVFLLFGTLSSLSTNKIKLAHDMKNGNKSYETNTHDKHNIWGDLEAWSIICVKLEHAPSCPS